MVDPASGSLPFDRTGVSGAIRKFSKSSSRIKEEFEHLGVLHRTDFPLSRWQWTKVKVGDKDIYLQKSHLAKRNVFKIGDALYVEDKVLGRGVAKVAKIGKRLVGSGAVKVAITFSLNPGKGMPVSDRAIKRLLSHHIAREFCSAKEHEVRLIGERSISGILRTSELGVPLDQVLKKELLPIDKSLIIKRLAGAVDSLRKAGVYHGDLKLDNVILVAGEGGDSWQLKFIDFDGARTYDETSCYQSPSLHSSLGIALMDLEHPDPAVLEDHDIYTFALMAAELKGIKIPAKIQKIEDAITSIIVCRNEIKVEKMHDPDSEMIPMLERHMEADQAMVAKLLTEVSFEETDDPQSLCIQGMLVASSLEARKGFFEQFLTLI